MTRVSPSMVKMGKTEEVEMMPITEIWYDSPQMGRVPGYVVVPTGSASCRFVPARRKGAISIVENRMSLYYSLRTSNRGELPWHSELSRP
jgi:hypothetical protein